MSSKDNKGNANDRSRGSAGAASGASGANTSELAAIIEQIRQGLTGDPQHDAPYLQQQIEQHQNHPLAKEIARECGRMLWDVLPEEQRKAFAQTMDKDTANTMATLAQTALLQREGKSKEALQTIEPLAKQMAQSMDKGLFKDDKASRYFDFETPEQELVWRAHNEEKRTIRHATQPFTQVFSAYASCLYDAERFDDAIAALKKALRWNPANADLYLEIGENYKRLGRMPAYERSLDEAYKYIDNPDTLARFHRSKGYLQIDKHEYRIAAAHLVLSLVYQESQMARGELLYLQQKMHRDFTKMQPDEAKDILVKWGESVGAAPETLQALVGAIKWGIDQDVYTATRAAVKLYGLTGDEEVGKMARDLVDALNKMESEK